jgi:hypothetical protein
VQDVEPFIEWLQGQGLPEEHLKAYRHYLAELAKHPSLSAALRAAEEAGTPPRQIANLRQAAARFAQFEEARSRPAPVATPTEPVKSSSAGSVLEVEPKQARPAQAPQESTALRRGCTCKKRYDVYLDNDFGSLAGLLGGGIGIGGVVLVRFFGILGALAIALGFAGMGGFVTIFSICVRCQGCRNRIYDLDEDEIRDLRKGRSYVVLATIGLLVGAAVCAYLWWTLVTQTRYQRY